MMAREWTIGIALLVMTSARAAAAPPQTEQDEYTRYELLAPDTAAFKIDYEVTATTAGARMAVADHASILRALTHRRHARPAPFLRWPRTQR